MANRVTTQEDVVGPSTATLWRAVCSCQKTPFYEGTDEHAARRFFLTAAGAERPGHVTELQRADVAWVTIEQVEAKA